MSLLHLSAKFSKLKAPVKPRKKEYNAELF